MVQQAATLHLSLLFKRKSAFKVYKIISHYYRVLVEGEWTEQRKNIVKLLFAKISITSITLCLLTKPVIQCLGNQRIQKTCPKPAMLWYYILNDPISRPWSKNKLISFNRLILYSNKGGIESNWLVFASNFEDHWPLFQNIALNWLIVIVQEAVQHWDARANMHNCIAMIRVNVTLQNA